MSAKHLRKLMYERRYWLNAPWGNNFFVHNTSEIGQLDNPIVQENHYSQRPLSAYFESPRVSIHRLNGKVEDIQAQSKSTRLALADIEK